MSTFPIREDEYSVEEISYEDMMSLLSAQKGDGTKAMPQANEEPVQMAKSDDDSGISLTNQLRQDELSIRLSENANKSLPAWLLNN